MSRVNLEQLKSAIRDIPDFPKPGIIFKDITPILGDGQLFQSVIDHLGEEAEKVNPSKVVGIDARGFLFGAAVAYKLGLGCVPIRKKGKLPYQNDRFLLPAGVRRCGGRNACGRHQSRRTSGAGR